MRVTLILPNLTGGGAERVALTLAQDLLAHDYEVDIVLTGSGGDLIPLIPEGATLFELKAKRFRNAVLPLARYFRARKPDATHALMWPVTVVAIVAHRLAGRPGRMVVSSHTTLGEQHRDDKFVLSTIRASTAFTYRAADARIGVSEGTARDLVALSGLPRDRFDVIYNPVIPPEPMPAASPGCRALWRGEGARILTVGSLKDAKNHALLIRAFARVARRRPASLLILGEGPLRGEMEALARELGVADRVAMPGFVADPWPVYASADLFVLSSDYEGYPLVLIEAMLAGVPVISTDCQSGPSEILGERRYGRLVPVGDVDALADAVVETLEHPLPAETLRSRAEQLSAGALDAHRAALLGAA